jgi:3-isopropylmalate/(R)-2-methylmalate dehydratase small subunit
MQPFTTHTGLVCAMDRSAVDTDQIIPKQFLKRIERTGYGPFLFYDWRYEDDGTTPRGEFELNRPQFAGASVLLARRNFGCGSSREHAVWAIENYGFRAVIAPSFADIFYNNCFKNGILPIVVSPEDLKKLMDDADRGSNATLSIDLPNQEIRGPDGGTVKFDLDPFRKHCLMNGLDDIALSLEKSSAIDSFEKKQATSQPWL